MRVNLDDWVKSGWLKRHKTSAREIADLLDLAQRDLATSLLTVQVTCCYHSNTAAK